MKKKICIISYSVIKWDGRVLRQIEFLKSNYEVMVLGFGEWTPPTNVKFLKLRRNIIFPLWKYFLLFCGGFDNKYYLKYFWLKKHYKQTLDYLLKNDFDLIHCNDWDLLPIINYVKCEKKCSAIFDAHEYFLSKSKRDLVFNLLMIPYIKFIMSNFSKNIDKFITVSQGIRYLYQKRFNWDIEIVMNAPYYEKIKYKSTSKEEIKIIYHGHASSSRKLERLIDLVPKLDSRFSLYLMLLGTDKKYCKKLYSLSRKTDKNRIVFVDPVLPSEITKEISKYDIGIFIFDGDEDNHYYVLPNKFFEYSMAGLCVLVSPLPEMKLFLEKFGNGLCPSQNKIDLIAEKLNHLTIEELNRYKQNSLKMALEINAENELSKLLRIYEALLS